MFLKESLESGCLVTMEAFNKFNKWYSYEGGKTFLLKKERDENLKLKHENDFLVETKEIASVWLNSKEFLSPSSVVQLEAAIWLTLQIEWKDPKIYFDYENNEILCETKNKKTVLKKEGTI